MTNSDYTLYQFPTSRPTLAALAIRKNTVSTLGISSHSTSNLCIVQCRDSTSNRKIFLISVYIEPRHDPYNTLANLEQFILCNNNASFLICGDFNGWHGLWGSRANNDRGDLIFDLICNNNFIIHNTGNSPTFHTVTHQLPRESIIDLTLTSNCSHIHINNWSVNSGLIVSSDHFPITFKVSFNNIALTKNKKLSTFRYNTAFIRWKDIQDKFADEVGRELPSVETINSANSHDLDNIINKLTSTLQKTCDKLLPRSRHAPPKAPFWNENLQSLKEKVLHAHHRLCRFVRRKLPLNNVIVERDRARREYSTAFCAASTEHFREFCTRQTKEDVWSVTNRLIKTKPLSQPPSTLRLSDGSYTSSTHDTADALIRNFFPDDSNDVTDAQIATRTLMSQPINTLPEPNFTFIEILNGLRQMNHKKAPGIDHLTSDICLQFATCFPDFITTLYNRCLTLLYFPRPWKHAVVKIIPKPGKDNYSQLSSFRPIGLINVLGKLLERLIIDRLTFHLNRLRLSNPRQFGFKQQTSTSKAIITALDLIRSKKARGEHVIAVSLDIKAAFDNAWWPAVFARLRHYDCPSNIYYILLNYIQNRTVGIDFSDISVTKTMRRGCVQGSVCGPTMWNLIMDELLDIDLPTGCHIQAYADDVLLITHSSSLSDLQTITNNALDLIYNWGSNVKLRFGPEKTTLTAFTNKANSVSVIMNNVQLEFIVHGFRTLSTITSISIAQLIPLPEKIKSVATIETSKHLGYSSFLPSDIPLEKPSPPSSLLHPSLRTPITFTEISSMEEFSSLSINYSYHIFTDGSKHDGVVGAAFVAFDPCEVYVTKKFKLHPSCSVFQAEMLAIHKACEWIASNSNNINSCIIFSDSKSSLQELSNPYSYNTFAVNIFHLLHTLSSSNINVGFAWVKAHIGIAGNEIADIAAKSAASLHKSPDFIHTPISHIKLRLRDSLMDSRKSFYEQPLTSCHTKKYLPTFDDLSAFLSLVSETPAHR
ncbi:unnamed protein product [Leptosia nina]|uniref:RNA-directed DNA polymerase from mobile element jockey n=1 Tax=Leptosia nina TaxID=320188 RepID=A0AAV1JKN1_9NEOP